MVGEKKIDSTNLHWHTQGHGPDMVLLHGWGMNGAVWQDTVERLQADFRVHVVDMPGYGFSRDIKADTPEQIRELLLKQAPPKAVWLGWSLGGLIASDIALHHAERVSHLLTVASSPMFAADLPWRGIKPEVLQAFNAQLSQDFQTTVERFMALQAMGSPSSRQDIKGLKEAVFSRPQPCLSALKVGLAMLAQYDLRQQISQLTVPTLRLYGRLDGLVPVAVAEMVSSLHPSSGFEILTQSSHAPFITEPEAFCEHIGNFILAKS